VIIGWNTMIKVKNDLQAELASLQKRIDEAPRRAYYKDEKGELNEADNVLEWKVRPDDGLFGYPSQNQEPFVHVDYVRIEEPEKHLKIGIADNKVVQVNWEELPFENMEQMKAQILAYLEQAKEMIK
jgi:hypothetical protein